MNSLMRRSIQEFERQADARELFRAYSRRLVNALDAFEDEITENGTSRFSARKTALLLLTPLVEVAWTDGEVNEFEQQAVLEIAVLARLTDDLALYEQLLMRLRVKPAPRQFGGWWREIADLCVQLPPAARETVFECLNFQLRHVGEQSHGELFGLWRGRRAGRLESEKIGELSERLVSVRKLAATKDSASAEKKGAAPDSTGVLKVVPLVKVAWADGSVTRRERHLVFEIASRYGARRCPETADRIRGWLERHPTEDFYRDSMARLRAHWQSLPEEKRKSERFDLLSNCTLVAEASGGSSLFAGGGAKICQEEIQAVKQIAKILAEETRPA